MLAQTKLTTHQLSDERADQILAHCQAVEYEQEIMRMFGKRIPIPRLTAWFGNKILYSYSGISHGPEPLPAWLTELKKEVEAVAGSSFNCALINYYRDGSDSVSWHCDDEPMFGPDPVVASVSVGAERVFKLKHKTDKTDKASIKLSHGSILVMGVGCQTNYLHSVPKTKRAVSERFNITFRNAIY